MRRWLWRASMVLACVVVLAVVLWIARRPLFEEWLRGELGALVGDALGGTCTVDAIEGSWITDVTLRGVTVRDGDSVHSIESMDVAVVLSPLRLVRGDLSGVRSLRLTAGAIELDVRGGGAAKAEPAPAGGDIDLRPLAALLPDGARLAVDRLTLIGESGAHGAPLEASVPPRSETPGQPLALDARLGTARAGATLRGDGTIRFDVDAPEAASWARPFAELPGVHGGRVEGSGTLRIGAELGLQADLRITGLEIDGRRVDSVVGRCRIDGAGIHEVEAVVRAPGVSATLRNVSAELGARLAASLRGSVELTVDDLEPYAALMPEELRRALPATMFLRARADRGVLHVDEGHVRGAGLRLDVKAGQIAIAGGTLARSDVAFAAHLEEPSRLPIEGGWRPRRLSAEARWRGNQITVTVAAEVADAAGRTLTADGSIVATRSGTWSFRPDLKLAGTIAGGLAPVRATGLLTLDGERLGAAPLRIEPAGGGSVEATGTAMLADLGRLLAESELELRVDEVGLAPLGALLDAAPTLGGTVSGRARLAGGGLDLSLDAAVRGLVTGDLEIAVGLAHRDEECKLSKLALRGAGSSVEAEGTLHGLGLAPLIEEPQRVRGAGIDAKGRITSPDLALLQLERVLPIRLAGAVNGTFVTTGTAARPAPEVDLELRSVSVAAAEAPPVRNLSGRLRLSTSSVRLDDLTAEIDGQTVELAGSASSSDQGWRLADFAVRQAGGGAIEIAGRAGPGLLDDPVATLRRDADVTIELKDLRADPWLRRAGLEALSGQLSGRAHWKADGAPALDLTLAGTVRGLLADRGAPLAVELRARADDRSVGVTELKVRALESEISGSVALGGTSLDRLLTSGDDIVAAALGGELSLDGVDLATIEPRSIGLASLKGRLDGRLTLAGTFGDPQPRCRLDLHGVALRLAGGPRLDDLAGRLEVTRTAVLVQDLTARAGAAPVRVSGAFTTPADLRAWKDGRVDLKIRGENALLYRRDGLKLRADVDLVAQGPPNAVRLSGQIGIRNSKLVSRIPYFNLRRSGGVAAHDGIVLQGPDLGPYVRVELDVDATTKEPIKVTTNVFSGDVVVALKVRGPLATPRLEGTASVPAGRLSLPGVSMRTSYVLVRFEREDPRFPKISVQAEGRRHGYDVQLVARGRYDQPEVLLTSNPPLSSEELIVLVTTGARPESLRRQGVRGVGTLVGSYLAEEFADYLFGSESTEAKESFVERFKFEFGTEISANGNESLLVEFRVLDNVFLQGERDVYEDVNFGVVYRIRFQ